MNEVHLEATEPQPLRNFMIMNRQHGAEDESNSYYHSRQALQTPLQEHLTKILATSEFSRLTLVADNAHPPPITTSGNNREDSNAATSNSDHYRRMMILSRTSHRSLFRCSSDGSKPLERQFFPRHRDFGPMISKAETRWTSESLPSQSSASPPVPSSRWSKRPNNNQPSTKRGNKHSPGRPGSGIDSRRRKNRSRHLQLTSPTRLASPPASPALRPSKESGDGGVDLNIAKLDHNDTALFQRTMHSMPPSDDHRPPPGPPNTSPLRGYTSSTGAPLVRWDGNDIHNNNGDKFSDGMVVGISGSGSAALHAAKMATSSISWTSRAPHLASNDNVSWSSRAPNVALDISDSITIKTTDVETVYPLPSPPSPPTQSSTSLSPSSWRRRRRHHHHHHGRRHNRSNISPPRPPPRRVSLHRQCSDSVLVVPRRVPSADAVVLMATVPTGNNTSIQRRNSSSSCSSASSDWTANSSEGDASSDHSLCSTVSDDNINNNNNNNNVVITDRGDNDGDGEKDKHADRGDASTVDVI